MLIKIIYSLENKFDIELLEPGCSLQIAWSSKLSISLRNKVVIFKRTGSVPHFQINYKRINLLILQLLKPDKFFSFLPEWSRNSKNEVRTSSFLSTWHCCCCAVFVLCEDLFCEALLPIWLSRLLPAVAIGKLSADSCHHPGVPLSSLLLCE